MLQARSLCSLLSRSSRCIIDLSHHGTRNLYAPATLGIDGYLIAKEKIKIQLTNVDTFKSKMQEFVDDQGKNNMIFTEDLKNMIHIAENASDIELIEKMIKKFSSQNKDLRFGNYVFGPVAMRCFYNLKDVDTALRLFKDESLGGFFDQLMSYQVLLDMLYEKKRYQEVLDVYDIVKSRQVQGGRYPKHVVVLVFASCYKLNTPESLKYGLELWKELQQAGHIPMRKAATFISALALNQNSPHITLEIAATIKQQKYMTVRNLKIAALADMKRFEDIIPILRSVLEVENAVEKKQTFAADVMEKVEAQFEKVDNKDLQMDFQRVLKFLKEHGHIGKETLDSLLSTEIASTAQGANNYQSRDKNFVAANFRQNRNDGNFRYKNQGGGGRDQFNRRNRPGLQEMY